MGRSGGDLDDSWTSESMGSVVWLSAARARAWERNAHMPEVLSLPAVAPMADYDWEAAALRRPSGNQCERVILHPDRAIDARMGSSRYYTREATARLPEPWPEAERRPEPQRARAVRKRRSGRWLGAAAVLFGVLLVGFGVVAPMMISSAVAGVEVAVGQAEDQLQQLGTDNAAMSAQISTLSSPQKVAEQAAQLGLVPAGQISYLPGYSGEQLLATEGDTNLAGR